MKFLKIFSLAIVLSFAASCNQPEEQPETIDSQENQDNTPATGEVREDDDNSIGIDVSADEDGNVEGEFKGDIKLEDRK